MSTKAPISRRTLVLSTIGGLLAGGAWGAAIQELATPSVPSLSIVGKGNQQVVLLDTTKIRVLLLLGTPEQDLTSRVPSLLTMIHQRIDVVIGTSPSIAALGPGFARRWQVAHHLLVPDGAAGPNTSDRSWVTRDLVADLKDGLSLTCYVTTRGAWSAAKVTQYIWAVALDAGKHRVLIAPDLSSAEIFGGGEALVIVPEADVNHLTASTAPAGIATNDRDSLESPSNENGGTRLIRIYPEDIARFELDAGGITLPDWAEGSS